MLDSSEGAKKGAEVANIGFTLPDVGGFDKPERLPLVQMRPEAKSQLIKFIEARSLKLVHATQTANLASILDVGLIPISDPGFYQLAQTHRNDTGRSGHGANCLSVGWPNIRTLSSWGPLSNFALIEIDPYVLLKKPWFVFETNSAARECLDSFRNSPAGHCGPKALANLFRPIATTNLGRRIERQTLKLNPSLPNDPQAEIIIDARIEPWWFERITFATRGPAEDFATRYNHVEVICDPTSFKHRVDHQLWKNGERVTLSSKEA